MDKTLHFDLVFHSSYFQEIQVITKRKEKEINELVDLELKKAKYEQELERSFIEIRNMSKVCKKLRHNNRPEPNLEIVDIVKPVNESDPQLKPRELAHEEQEDNILNFQAQNHDFSNFHPLVNSTLLKCKTKCRIHNLLYWDVLKI